jgi:Universal stress protein family
VPNPFRSEESAFRFVFLTIGYFAVVVAAWWINKWLGLGVWIVLTAGLGWWLFFRRAERERPVPQTSAPHAPDEHRILVVANETVGGQELLAEVRGRAADGGSRILVVCPALNSPIRHWASDEDQARAAAQARLDASLGAMRAAGLQVEGEIGDGDPIQAIEDAVRTFQPDELVISTHPEGRSHWLERGVVEKAHERFAIPITHVVVDLSRT